MKTQYPKPALIGRTVRLLLGAGILSGLLLTAPSELSDPDGLFWILTGYAVWSLPEEFDVLLDQDWGRWPQGVLLGIAIVVVMLDLLLYGRLWAPPLAWLLYGLDWVVLGTLMISFLLAGTLGVPGCEWRAIPYLLAQIGDHRFEPHPCSLYLHKLDRWEARRKKKM